MLYLVVNAFCVRIAVSFNAFCVVYVQEFLPDPVDPEDPDPDEEIEIEVPRTTAVTTRRTPVQYGMYPGRPRQGARPVLNQQGSLLTRVKSSGQRRHNVLTTVAVQVREILPRLSLEVPLGWLRICMASWLLCACRLEGHCASRLDSSS